MKKLIILFILFLTSCTSVKKDEFVNPIFYNKMVGTYTKYDTVQITPTSYHITNFYGYQAKAECELLENTWEKVTLKCLHLPHDKNNENELIIVGEDDEPTYWTYKYILAPEDEQTEKNGKFITRYTYDENSYWCKKDIRNCSRYPHFARTSPNQ